ncbi:MAG: glycine C-acetyltransferase [Ignavibacteria bacterium]|nr:glycine C-acetyltransferase [Ignavibacteria bacterium]
MSNFLGKLRVELDNMKVDGLYKHERVITSDQGAAIKLDTGKEVLNFCANNYLGLSSDPAIIKAAKKTLDSHGFGMSSVRFICGTQDIHKELEQKIADYHGTEDAILYAACFDANGGVFESILHDTDAIISDELNHASIIDGIRLAKATRHRYKNNDMDDLRRKLDESVREGAKNMIIVTDGVFSMDGYIANLKEIVKIAKEYDILTMVDECHAAGFLGKNGRGAAEHCGVHGQIDIVTGTLGKALGGAMGGYTTGRKEIIEMLRQRSRPYLFSNSLAPAIVGASIAVFDLLTNNTELRDKLEENTIYFRSEMSKLGFDIKEGTHPIVPVMLYDAKLSQTFSAKLLDEGIYVIGFYYPVVPKGRARIRVQVSAAHTKEHLDKAISSFEKVGKELKVIE